MSSATIAYSHKGGFWKTKYTYLAGWFGRVGKLFYSRKGKTKTDSVAWRHNSDTAKRTAYYIASDANPIGSGMSVSFNKNVSQNKIYKSFSIEGTSNIAGANSFTVNSDSSDVKSGSVGRLTNKGGVLYGHIGRSSTLLDGSNMSLVGTISSKAFYDSANNETHFYITSSGPLKTSLASKHVVYDPASQSFKNFSGTTVTISESQSFGSVGGTVFDTIVHTSADAVDLVAEAGYANSIKRGSPVKVNGNYKSFIDQSYGTGIDTDLLMMFEITPEVIDGAPPRGQYAQLNISLGSEPYELFALNLNYEPTDLDHSK